MLENLLDWAGFHDAAFGQQEHFICDLAGKAHFVRHENEIAAGVAQFFDGVEDFGGHLRIEGGSRFIEQQ